MEQITLTMQHSAKSVAQLSKTQYSTFHAKAKVFWYVFFFACLLAGVGVFGTLDTVPQILCLAVGGIGIMNVGASARVRTDKTLKLIAAHGNQFPATDITVSAKKVTILEQGADKPKRLDKKDVVRLAEDEQYWYVFISQESAYMLPKDQVEDLDGFVTLLEKATGQSVQAPFQLRNLTLGWIWGQLKKK